MHHFSYLSIFAAVQATPDGLRSQLEAISFGSVADVLADTGIKTNIHRQQLQNVKKHKKHKNSKNFQKPHF